MSQALKQAWWAPVAGLLVLLQVVLAVAFGFDPEDGESTIVAIAIALTGAVVLGAGLWKRPENRALGNALIVIGALLGAFWFWTLYMPVLAIIVLVGLVISEVFSPARAVAKP